MKATQILDQIFLPQKDVVVRRITAWWIAMSMLSLLALPGAALIFITRFVGLHGAYADLACFTLPGIVSAFLLINHTMKWWNDRYRPWWRECKIAMAFWSVIYAAYWSIQTYLYVTQTPPS